VCCIVLNTVSLINGCVVMKAIRTNGYRHALKSQAHFAEELRRHANHVVGTIRIMKMFSIFGISRLWMWRLRPSGVLRRVVLQDTNVSEEPIASFFMVVYLTDGETISTPWHWRYMQHVSPKRWSTLISHDVTTQKLSGVAWRKLSRFTCGRWEVWISVRT
jgi:hypothetical protein